VRMSGNDSNPGTSPGAALQTLTKAATLLAPGTTVYVGPGHYTEPTPGKILITGVAGTASAPIHLIADTTGSHTGDPAGDVTLDAGGDTVTLNLTKSTFFVIDGFTLTGALPKPSPSPVSGTEIEVRSGSNNVTIQNCIVGQSSTADGIRIDGSTDALVFNNLISETDRGILISGAATGARVINNTIVNTQRTGVALTVKSGSAPTGATLTNNVLEAQGTHLAINVDQGPPSAQDGYAGNFNLAFEASQSDQTKDYSPVGINGTNDLNVDGLLINLGVSPPDVHLSHDSPAIDAGDDSIDAALVSALTARSTRDDGSLDRTPLDLGYHYP
jgi:parallel beta-helix repeat protein